MTAQLWAHAGLAAGETVMSVHSALGFAAGLILGASFFPYVRAILRGETKPSRASWFIWALVSVITAATYRASGAEATFPVAVAFAIVCVAIALLSLPYSTAPKGIQAV
jgi:hypothetical protein